MDVAGISYCANVTIIMSQVVCSESVTVGLDNKARRTKREHFVANKRFCQSETFRVLSPLVCGTFCQAVEPSGSRVVLTIKLV